jgi:hypothetical protein
MAVEGQVEGKKKKSKGQAPAAAAVVPAAAPAPARAASNVRNYGSWSAEAAEEDLAKSKADSAGEYLNLKLGRNRLRILPPAAGRSSPFQAVKQHYVEIPGGQKKGVAFVCPKAHGGGRCPACERADRLRQTGNAADYEAAKKYMPRNRYFANVVDRSDPDRGVVKLPFGKTVYEELLALRNNVDVGGDFTNPGPDGFDVIVEKSGEGLKTEYKVHPARENSELGCDEWLDELHDLAVEAAPLPYAEIMKRLGAGDDDDAPPARQRASGRDGSAGGRGGGRGRTVEDDADATVDDSW